MYLFGAASVTQHCACEFIPVAYSWSLFIFITVTYSLYDCMTTCLSILLLMDMWLVPILASTEFQWIYMYCILVRTCMQFWSVNKWLGVELLGHRVSSTLIDNTKLFTSGFTSVSSHQQCLKKSLSCSTSSSALVSLSDFSHSGGGPLGSFNFWLPNFIYISLVWCLVLVCWPSGFVLLWRACSSSCMFFCLFVCLFVFTE